MVRNIKLFRNVLISAFYYEGKEYEFNFSKVLDAVNTRFKSYEDDEYVYWKVWQESRTAFVKVSARCRKEDMLFINYEAPDGTKRHNHLYNGGNAEARIRLYEKKNGRLYLVDDINETDELMFTEDFDELSFADDAESTENTTVDADAVKSEDTTEE